MNAKLSHLILLITAPVLLSACSVAKGDTPPESDAPSVKSVQVITLQKTRVGETLELTGIVSGRSQTMLSAKAPGRIQAVYADVGDSVKKGDLLVQLAGDEVAVSLQTARSGYQNTLANLSSTRALLNTQIGNAEKGIDTLKTRIQALENARKSVDEISARQVKLAEEQVSLTETRLANVSRSLNKNQADIISQKERLITQATILSNSVLNQLYGTLSLNAGNLNYETSLDRRFGQSGYQSRLDTLQALKDLRDEVKALQFYYDTNIKSGGASDQERQKGFDLAEGTLEVAKHALETVHDLLLHTVVHNELPQTQLDQLRATVTGMGQQVESLLLSVSGGQVIGLEGLAQAEAGLDVERENQQNEFESQLSIAAQQLALARETRRQQLNEIDDNLLILRSQLAEAQNGRLTAIASRDAQVQLLKTQADQAKGQLAMAEVTYENTRVLAPSDGIILSRMAEDGTVVGAGTPLLEFADPGRLKIDTEVTEEEAAQIKTGMTARFTIDSLPGQTYQARLTRLGAHADPLTRKVPVEFEVIGNADALRIGAYARLELILGESKNLLLIPDSALLRSGRQEAVFVIQNGAAYEVAVNLGRRHSDELEVISGVYEGNQLVISGLEGLTSGDPVEILNTSI